MPTPTLAQALAALQAEQDRQQAAQAPIRAQGQQALADAAARGGQYDILNFAAANSGNQALAQSIAAMNAQAHKGGPVQLGNTGFMVPETGQFIESPMYTDEKNSSRAAKTMDLLISQEAANARAQEKYDYMERDSRRDAQTAADRTSLLSMSRGAMTEAQLRADADRDERRAHQTEQDALLRVEKFGATLQRVGIPTLQEAIKEVHGMLEKPEGELKGLGYGMKTASKIPLIGEELAGGQEGMHNRSVVQKIVNAMSLTEAGKALTKQESVNQALVNMANDNYSEASFRTAMEGTILPALESSRINVLRSADPAIVDRYEKNFPGPSIKESFLPPKKGPTQGKVQRPAQVPTPAGFPRVTSQVQAGRDSERVAILQEELNDPRYSASDRAAIQAELARATGGKVKPAPKAMYFDEQGNRVQ